jgi:Ran-binding protein 3
VTVWIRADEQEPTHPSEPPTTAPKKNRLATGQTPSKPLDPDPTPNLDAGASAAIRVAAPATPDDIEEDAEGEAREKDNDGTNIVTEQNGLEKVDWKDGKEVGEVRRRVAEMTYEEGIELDKREGEDEGQELPLPPKDKGQPNSAMSLETRVPEQGTEVSENGEAVATQKTETDEVVDDGTAAKAEADEKESASEGLKRKALDRSTSSYVDEATTKRARDDGEVSYRTPRRDVHSYQEKAAAPEQAAPPPVKKPQPSFSAFASASPFASAAKSSPLVSGGMSPFASAGASPFATAGASGSKPSSVFGAKSSGFGNYSNSASPFAKAAPNATEEEEPEEKEANSDKTAKPSASFGDILKADTGPERAEEEKVQMAEQDGELCDGVIIAIWLIPSPHRRGRRGDGLSGSCKAICLAKRWRLERKRCWHCAVECATIGSEVASSK